MSAIDEIEVQTQAQGLLVPPPRWPRTALGAEAVPPPPPHRQSAPAPTRRYVLVYSVRRAGWIRALAVSVILGAFAAITRLGPHPFSWRGILPVLAAGAVFGAVLAFVRRRVQALPHAHLALAGGIAGVAWWLLVRPASPLLNAALLGAVLANGVAAFEAWLQRAAA